MAKISKNDFSNGEATEIARDFAAHPPTLLTIGEREAGYTAPGVLDATAAPAGKEKLTPKEQHLAALKRAANACEEAHNALALAQAKTSMAQLKMDAAQRRVEKDEAE